MSKTPDIIEAIPQSLQREYNKTRKKLWITAGVMIGTTGMFFAGINSPYAGDLGMFWFYSDVVGSGYVWWLLKRKGKLMERMESPSTKTTYVDREVVEKPEEPVAPKGRNRILRLMPPGLNAGIPFRWFK